MSGFNFKKPTSNAVQAARSNVSELPKSEFWLNVGYYVEVPTEDGEGVENVFVSLPMGIALEGQKTLPTNSSNARFAALNQARNELYEQLMAACQGLEPGEEQPVPLELQARRVRGEQPTVNKGNNPFIKNLFK